MTGRSEVGVAAGNGLQAGGHGVGGGPGVGTQVGGVDGQERGGGGVGGDQAFEGTGDRFHVVERAGGLDQHVVLQWP